MAKKNLMKLNAAINAMLKRAGGHKGLSNDAETVKTLDEMKQDLVICYSTGFANIVDIIRSVKSLDQVCMLGDLARYIVKYKDMDEEYARINDMPEGEDMAERIQYIKRDIAWLWNQIPNYNKPIEELNFEAECEYYEYPAYPDAEVMLKINKISSWSYGKGSSVHSEIRITAEYKTYFEEYNVVSYDPENYDKDELVKIVKAALEKAINEIELD